MTSCWRFKVQSIRECSDVFGSERTISVWAVHFWNTEDHYTSRRMFSWQSREFFIQGVGRLSFFDIFSLRSRFCSQFIIISSLLFWLGWFEYQFSSNTKTEDSYRDRRWSEKIVAETSQTSAQELQGFRWRGNALLLRLSLSTNLMSYQAGA